MIAATKKMKLWIPIFIAGTWCLALSASAVAINTTIPGMGAASSSTPPGQWVSSLYNFALMIGGVLAFGAIVYGGVLYASSMGNPSKQSEGREWIQSALLGLLLLGGAYLVLYTINPALVNLTLPSLATINIAAQQAPSPPPATPSCSGSNECDTCCPSNQHCQLDTTTNFFSCISGSPPATPTPDCGDSNMKGNGLCSNLSDGTVRHCCLYVDQWVCQTKNCGQ